jgi:hypothetical protein
MTRCVLISLVVHAIFRISAEFVTVQLMKPTMKITNPLDTPRLCILLLPDGGIQNGSRDTPPIMYQMPFISLTWVPIPLTFMVLPLVRFFT